MLVFAQYVVLFCSKLRTALFRPPKDGLRLPWHEPSMQQSCREGSFEQLLTWLGSPEITRRGQNIRCRGNGQTAIVYLIYRVFLHVGWFGTGSRASREVDESSVSDFKEPG